MEYNFRIKILVFLLFLFSISYLLIIYIVGENIFPTIIYILIMLLCINLLYFYIRFDFYSLSTLQCLLFLSPYFLLFINILSINNIAIYFVKIVFNILLYFIIYLILIEIKNGRQKDNNRNSTPIDIKATNYIHDISVNNLIFVIIYCLIIPINGSLNNIYLYLINIGIYIISILIYL